MNEVYCVFKILSFSFLLSTQYSSPEELFSLFLLAQFAGAFSKHLVLLETRLIPVHCAAHYRRKHILSSILGIAFCIWFSLVLENTSCWNLVKIIPN